MQKSTFPKKVIFNNPRNGRRKNRSPRSQTFLTPQIPHGIKFITSWLLDVLAKILWGSRKVNTYLDISSFFIKKFNYLYPGPFITNIQAKDLSKASFQRPIVQVHTYISWNLNQYIFFKIPWGSPENLLFPNFSNPKGLT